MLRRLRRCSWKQLLVVVTAVTVLSTLYHCTLLLSSVYDPLAVISSDQLMNSNTMDEREWMEKLSIGPNVLVQDGKIRTISRNITRPMITNHSVMPVQRGLPAAEAELNFHQYVSQVQVECKHRARIGNVSDGGWDVCLSPPFHLVQPCLVYSFGIGDNWSFDDELAAKYGCVVRAFDPSINKPDHVRANHIWFYAVGIGKENSRDRQYGWPLQTFSALMSMCRDNNKTIDILKLDVESSEWGALETMLEERMLHRVKQLAIEIHTRELFRLKSSVDDLIRYSSILSRLEQIGFRKWHWNFNVWGFFPARDGSKYLSCCYELGYINMNFAKQNINFTKV